jgi:hypothetical protein
MYVVADILTGMVCRPGHKALKGNGFGLYECIVCVDCMDFGIWERVRYICNGGKSTLFHRTVVWRAVLGNWRAGESDTQVPRWQGKVKFQGEKRPDACQW